MESALWLILALLLYDFSKWVVLKLMAMAGQREFERWQRKNRKTLHDLKNQVFNAPTAELKAKIKKGNSNG